MDFKLKIFVYLDDSLPTPEAVLLVRQVFSQSHVFAGITPDISPTSPHRLCITFTFPAKTTGQADNKADEFVQSLLECTSAITDGIREGSNVYPTLRPCQPIAR